MTTTMGFFGATVDTLLEHRHVTACGTEIDTAAEDFLAALTPIGDPFAVPWKLFESLQILSAWVPEPLAKRLSSPGLTAPVNHLEASMLSLVREVDSCLEPLTKADMHRIQHGVQCAIDADDWGRHSPYPWDTVAQADIDSWGFFALHVPA